MEPVVALEIGTSKTIALVGEMREDGSLMITGKGEHPSAGVRKGEIIDAESVLEVARKTLRDAETTGNVLINGVVMALTGGHIRGTVYSGVVPVLDQGGLITIDDIEEVQTLARTVNLPEDREMILTIDQHYTVDDHEPVINPEGMVGAKLGLNILGFNGVRGLMKTAQKLVERIPMEVQDSVFGGLGAALAVLTPEQKRSGALVIDLGAGTTDYIAYAGEVMACGGSIGVGGDHVTNDIVLGFNIAQARAEKIKKEYGRAMVPEVADPTTLTLPTELGFPGQALNLRSLHVVINERMKETFEIIRRRLEQIDALPRLGSGVVLTGGGAHMRGIHELAGSIFGLPCTTGIPRNVLSLHKGVESPEYATCCGLIEYAFRTQDEDGDEGDSLLESVVRKIFRRG